VVTAVYAFTPSYAEVSPDQYQVLSSQAEHTLTRWYADSDDAASVRSLVVGGGPDALLTASRKADLLVVGTRGAGGFAHLHVGSVAHHLAHHTLVPLAIVPTSAADNPVTRIVLGVDGSVGSAAAVNFCAAFASRIGATVVAVHALNSHAESVPEIELSGLHQDADATVREWVAPIEASGVPVDVEVQRDVYPVVALRRAIEAEPDTLAVVGTRGLGGFSELRLGRVAIQLVHSTGAAVVLVPAMQRNALSQMAGQLSDSAQWPLDSSYRRRI
jgi:nucleotide-binding universal stress UspA family protein